MHDSTRRNSPPKRLQVTKHRECETISLRHSWRGDRYRDGSSSSDGGSFRQNLPVPSSSQRKASRWRKRKKSPRQSNRDKFRTSLNYPFKAESSQMFVSIVLGSRINMSVTSVIQCVMYRAALYQRQKCQKQSTLVFCSWWTK